VRIGYVGTVFVASPAQTFQRQRLCQPEAPMPTPQISITDWKPRISGSLRGFCTARLPSGMILHEVGIHTRNGSWWASPASKPMLNKEGVVLRDEAGKVRYSPIVSFADKQTRDRLSRAVVDALRAARPEIFTGAAT
jgi:hypothetical protein